MEEPKDIRETRRVPSVAEQFPNCTPHEPSEGTVEKDVIVIFNFPTKGTKTQGRPPTPPDVLIRREAFPSELPKKNPDL
jgi:hypothetical protein